MMAAHAHAGAMTRHQRRRRGGPRPRPGDGRSHEATTTAKGDAPAGPDVLTQGAVAGGVEGHGPREDAARDQTERAVDPGPM